MNSRERVMISLNHKEPDKVPIDLNGTISTSLTRLAYENLRKFLNLSEDKNIEISDITLGSVRSSEDLLSHYEIDIRSIHMEEAQYEPKKIVSEDAFYDSFGTKWKKASYYYDVIERPLASASRISDLNKIDWSRLCDRSKVKNLKEKVRNAYNTSSYCLVGDMHSDGPFEGACNLKGHDKFLLDLYINEKFALALLDKVTELCLANWELFLNEVGEYVQVVAQGDDVAMQNSPFISIEMYRKYIKPLHKRIFDFIHSKTKAKVFLHSCGSVYDFIPEFIEMGVDILNPVQRSAAKMDIKRLKKNFGSDICFWGGGIDVQKQLPFFSLKQIEDEIKRTLDILAPEGGYIFFPTHNIQPDVSPDRIDCMFKTVLGYRDYKNF